MPKTITGLRPFTKRHIAALLTILVGVYLLIPSSGHARSQCETTASGSTAELTEETLGNLPDWWGNDLGNEELVPPGYATVTSVTDTVELYQREYKWGRHYFPHTVNSRGNSLAGGMRLTAHIDGRLIELRPETVALTNNNGHSVTVLSSGEPLPGLRVKVETRVEYDGVAMARIELIPEKPIELQGLDYEVSITDSPTMEVIAFKASDIRKQKDRNDMVELPYGGEFLNAIGFADGSRSFWWFADNAKGWIWNAPTVTEIERLNGKIRLRQRLIGASWTVKQPMHFNVNFLATPVRDLGSEWRSRRVIHGAPSEAQATLGGVFKLWWTSAFAHDAFPYVYYPKEIAAQVPSADRSAFPGAEYNARLVKTAKAKYGAHWIPYFSAHVLSNLDPALNKFQSEWEIHPRRQFNEVVQPYKRVYGKPVLSHQAKSYSDYVLWGLNQTIDRLGTEGIYLDHGPPHDSCNPHTGGWIDSNGRLQPSLDILGVREFLKRMRVLFASKGKAGYIFIHTSNREIIPAYTFAYATVNGEQYRNGRVRNGDYLASVPLNEFRTRFSPDQYGVLTVLLPTEWTYHADDTQWAGSEKQRVAYRRLLALALLHDIADWPIGSHQGERGKLLATMDRFGINHAEFVGYWDSRITARADHSGIKISSYVRKDKDAQLVIVANVTNKPIKAKITFNLPSPGSGRHVSQVLAEHGSSSDLTTDSPTYSILVPAKDFRWLWVKHDP